jgi:NitT/TauT family transport system substrate-binding protein
MQRAEVKRALALLGAVLAVRPAGAEPFTLYLNWSAGADHAPLYYARAQGWFKQAGLDVQIERGAGAYATVQRVAATAGAAGVADLTSVLVARGSGLRTVAAMNIFANSPYMLYWARSSGIRTFADIGGRKLGALPNDPTRVLWNTFAKANGLTASVTWVDVGPNAKPQALKDKTIEVAPNAYFYQQNALEQLLGADMGKLAWRDAGFNLYGNSLIMHPDLIARHPNQVKTLVRSAQRAYYFCLKTPEPCIAALAEANPALNQKVELQNWKLARELIVAQPPLPVAFGAFDPVRVQHDYAAISASFQLRDAFDPATTIDNGFLDQSVK